MTDHDDVIDGDVEEAHAAAEEHAWHANRGPVGPFRTSPAGLVASNELLAAEEEVRRAQLRVDEAKEAAEDARKKRLAAEDRAAEARARAFEQAEIEHEKAKDAARPPAQEWEIEVLDVRKEGRTTEVEFLVRGAPNFASYKGASPVLRVSLRVSSGSWDINGDGAILIPRTVKPKALGAGKPASAITWPRTRDLDGFYDSRLVEPEQPITEENIRDACERKLKEHLDLVDLERKRTPPSEPVEPITRKFKVRS